MSEETNTSVEGRTILIIEDEPFISELYSRALSQAGYTVTVVADGAEGQKTAQTTQFDVILLDLMLPNVNGIDILRTLRDPAQQPPLKAKIIVTTNLEQRDEVRADIEKQADAYLVKAELTPRQLVEFINKLQ
jgi:CheY-like chemotaxis protein